MKCKNCGNYTRFEMYRAEVVWHIVDFSRLLSEEFTNAISNSFSGYTGPIFSIQCIDCGVSGTIEDFALTEDDRSFLRERTMEPRLGLAAVDNDKDFAEKLVKAVQMGEIAITIKRI